jgi:hypothetical protein
MAIPASAQFLAWAAVAGGVGYAIVSQRDATRRLEALEEARKEAPAPVPAADGALEKRVAAVEARVAASESAQTAALAAVRGDVKKDVTKIWETLLAQPGAAATPGEQPGFEQAVRAVVDRYAMEHKFREAVQKAAGPLVPKKPSFVQLATALKLRPDQAERFGGEIRAIQMELYEILQVPRADGVAMWEEIQTAEQYPEGSPKRAEIFLKLFKLTIPDSSETYVEKAVELATKVKTGTKDYFDAEQSRTLDSLELDWFGIRMQQ